MEIQKDALLRVVKSARLSLKLAEDLNKSIVLYGKTQTVPDAIAGYLCDTLYDLCGEQLGPGMDFLRDSVTMKLLTGSKSDGEVADAFLRIAEEHRVKQPAPHTQSREEFRAMCRKCGGYMYETAEGEWE